MSLRNAGLLFIAAAALFWLSWFLMPGVGVTDAAQIFDLVAHKRSSVMVSVVTQLLSAALYVPALLGISCAMTHTYDSRVRWGAGLLLLGAMGSAMDAVFHLLAYAMTKPGLEPRPLLQVMAFMQGPGLRLVAPFIASFFLGGVFLSIALTKKGTVSKASGYIYLTALGFAAAGAAAVPGGIISTRAVGLSVLGAVSLAQASLGLQLGWAHGRKPKRVQDKRDASNQRSERTGITRMKLEGMPAHELLRSGVCKPFPPATLRLDGNAGEPHQPICGLVSRSTLPAARVVQPRQAAFECSMTEAV